MPQSIRFSSPIQRLESPYQRYTERKQEMSGNRRTEQMPSMVDMVFDKVEDVNRMQNHADSMVHQLLTGGDVNSAEVLTSVQKADMAFRTLLQVRNKLVDAYREVLQIQV